MKIVAHHQDTGVRNPLSLDERANRRPAPVHVKDGPGEQHLATLPVRPPYPALSRLLLLLPAGAGAQLLQHHEADVVTRVAVAAPRIAEADDEAHHGRLDPLLLAF